MKIAGVMYPPQLDEAETDRDKYIRGLCAAISSVSTQVKNALPSVFGPDKLSVLSGDWVHIKDSRQKHWHSPRFRAGALQGPIEHPYCCVCGRERFLGASVSPSNCEASGILQPYHPHLG